MYNSIHCSCIHSWPEKMGLLPSTRTNDARSKTAFNALHQIIYSISFCFVCDNYMPVSCVCWVLMSHFQSRLYWNAEREKEYYLRHFKRWKSTQLDCWAVLCAACICLFLFLFLYIHTNTGWQRQVKLMT